MKEPRPMSSNHQDTLAASTIPATAATKMATNTAASIRGGETRPLATARRGARRGRQARPARRAAPGAGAGHRVDAAHAVEVVVGVVDADLHCERDEQGQQ